MVETKPFFRLTRWWYVRFNSTGRLFSAFFISFKTSNWYSLPWFRTCSEEKVGKVLFKKNRKATDAQSSSTNHVLVQTKSAFIAHTSIRGNPLRWITGVLLLRQSPHLVLSIFSSGLLVIYFSIILFWEKQYKTFFYFTAILFLQKEFKPILLSLYEMFITQVRFRTPNNCLESLQLSLQWKKCFQDCKWVMSVKMQTRSVL